MCMPTRLRVDADRAACARFQLRVHAAELTQLPGAATLSEEQTLMKNLRPASSLVLITNLRDRKRCWFGSYALARACASCASVDGSQSVDRLPCVLTLARA